MRKFRVSEAETRRPLLSEVVAAERTMARLLGLMGRRGLEGDAGLYLPRCSRIHTCFLLFPIDVVYLDEAKKVKRIVAPLKPWRLSWCRGADSVLEAAAGWAERVGLREGAQIAFEDTSQARSDEPC